MRSWSWLSLRQSTRAVACVVLLVALPVGARESCPFQRDPAFLAHTSVAPAPAGELAVGTLNAFRLFDAEQDGNERDVLSAAQFAARIARIARYIADDMGAPALLALQEVEDDTSALALTRALERETGRDYRIVTGATSGDSDIRNYLLVDARLRVTGTRSLFHREPRAGKPLHDRLPLVVDIDAGGAFPGAGRFTVVVVHMKSQRGIDRPDDAQRVIAKRKFQAEELAAWTTAEAKAGRRLLVLGDFNAPILDATDVRGEPMRVLLAGGGLVDVAGKFLKPSQRWTYRYRCTLNELDHVLVSPALAGAVRGYAIAHGDTCLRAREKCDASHSVSDHEGVVLRLR